MKIRIWASIRELIIHHGVRHTVSCHLQIRKEVVSQGLSDICAIQFESHEHDASPNHDPEVDLAHKAMLFSPGPSCLRVEAM